MKKIEAIIRTSKFYEVKDAMMEAGIEFFSYSDIKAVGSKAQQAVYRGHVYDMGAIARTRIEVIVSENVEGVISAIAEAAKTGEVGDGRIYTYDVVSALKVRTGEKDKEALTN